jgi:putative ABC transport system ATP-binding protein
MKTLLKSNDLNKTFHIDGQNHQQVLHNINVDIEPGEFVAVMGPSGSGKSTLLYNLCGMDRMTSGSVIFRDLQLESMSEGDLARLRRTDMGFVFQQIHLLKNLSILDNILLPGFLGDRRPRKEITLRARDLMERTGIADLADRSITQASGGQLQRVGICRALINSPHIIFGDEPTGALNSRASGEIMDLLSEINRAGTTVLLVTHDVRVAARTHRILLMKDGHLVSQRRPGAPPRGEDALLQREEELAAWLLEEGV